MSGDSRVPAGAWPTATFSLDEKAIFVNGEAMQIVHQPAAHTDGDSLVFFRRSDVIAAGDLVLDRAIRHRRWAGRHDRRGARRRSTGSWRWRCPARRSRAAR